MGAYSQLDAELRYGSNSIGESSDIAAFEDDSDIPAFEDEAESSALSEDDLETAGVASAALAETVSQPQPQSITPPPAPSAPTQNDGASQEKSRAILMARIKPPSRRTKTPSAKPMRRPRPSAKQSLTPGRPKRKPKNRKSSMSWPP